MGVQTPPKLSSLDSSSAPNINDWETKAVAYLVHRLQAATTGSLEEDDRCLWTTDARGLLFLREFLL